MQPRPRTATRPQRPGFTLIEMLMVVSLMMLVFAAAVPFFRAQARAVDEHTGRYNATQTARYATAVIERDLRVAGNNTALTQPLLVQGDSMSVTFNVDLVSRMTADLGAVYYDPDAPTGVANVLNPASRITLPRSTRNYPDSLYRYGSGAMSPPSNAETISFWLAPDSTRPTDWVLWRRVNANPPTQVATGLVMVPGERPFRYFAPGTTGNLREIPANRTPFFHSSAVHDATGENAESRRADSVRVVRVRLTAMQVDPRRGEMRHTAEVNVRLRNAGLVRRNSCGNPPPFSSDLILEATGLPVRQVRLQWAPAPDDNAGDLDVERYAVYKRLASETSWSEPFMSIPAGQATYDVVDDMAEPGTWIYGVSAQDCTPSNSDIRTAQVIVP